MKNQKKEDTLNKEQEPKQTSNHSYQNILVLESSTNNPKKNTGISGARF